jgi:hypothetical protein
VKLSRLKFILKATKKIIILSLLLLCCFHQNITAQDTLPSPETKKKLFIAEPFRATMLAVALPGLGQIYNKKYWKVPFVYAGFGGIIFAISFNTTYYNRYMKGYQDFTDKIPETDSYLEIIKNVDPSTYDPVLFPDTYNRSSESWYREAMLRKIDYFKKYRDLSYIGIAAWYLFTILDANVDASLFNYDISDSLEMGIAPAQIPFPGEPGKGMSVNLKVKF